MGAPVVHSITGLVDWQQVYAVPDGRVPTKSSVRQIDDQTAVIHTASPAPAVRHLNRVPGRGLGAVRIECC